MSRQAKEHESQIVLKRPRHEDRLTPYLSSMSIPTSITPRVQGIDIIPAIRGVQDHMSIWMSSLIHAQDGCLQMVAQRASMGRIQQEQLAQQVAQQSTMPSMTDQVSYLRAQLAHRDALLEQVRAERDNHFVQEEEVLTHMRLLSSEAKDWKSRVVIEAEEVLCRESAHNKLPKHKRPWINITKHDGSKLKPTSKLYVNLTVPETNEEHQQLHTAQERQLQLEAQTLRAIHERELQAAQSAQKSENVIQELRRKAAEQPDLQKLWWKSQLSQQLTHKAEIHELHTELLNMKEKSETQSHLAANVCKIEQTVPSRSVESEPENVLNTRSPGRSTRWILPAELETPKRLTSSGLQSPVGLPVQLGPSPSTQEYVQQVPCGVPPAQWGDLHAREGDDGCELFGNMPEADDLDFLAAPAQNAEQQDELENAGVLVPANQSPISGAQCVNGNLVRPSDAGEEPPSTACRQSAVRALGGVALGRGPPGFGKSPGIIPGRQLPPPPPPPPPLEEQQGPMAQEEESRQGEHPYVDYISASKGKASTKGKGKQSDGKNGKSRWRPPCDDYWKPGGCSQGHHCPHYHPRKQPGRCAICGSTCHSTSQCNRPVKPKAKNVEWEESTWSYEDEECYDQQWESEEYEASKGKKGKGKGSKPKAKSKGKNAPRSITPRPITVFTV